MSGTILPFPTRTLRRRLRLGLGRDMTPDAYIEGASDLGRSQLSASSRELGPGNREAGSASFDDAGDQGATLAAESPRGCARCRKDGAMRGEMMRRLD